MNLFLLGIILQDGLIFHLLPMWQRRNLFFSASVPENYHDTQEAKSLVVKYRIGIWGVTLLALGLALALSDFEKRVVWILLAQSLAAVGLFMWVNSKVKASGIVPPVTVHSTSLAAETPQMSGIWIVALLPFMVLAAAGFYLNAHWNDIPARFPIHFDVAGNTNGWSNKTFKGVYGILFFAAALQLMFAFLVFAMLHGTRRTVPGSSRMRFMKANIWYMLGVEWITTLLFVYIATLPTYSSKPSGILLMGIVALLFPITVGFMVYMVRLQREPFEPDNTPDSAWLMGGTIYYNRQDPVFMVEKRLGLGYTFNMGHPFSWLFMGITAIVFILPVLLFTK